MKMLKMIVLTLAAWLRWKQVTDAINTIPAHERPLKNQPDWFLGWAMLTYKGNEWRGAKILYAACDAEWKLRRDLEEMRPEVRAAAEALIESPKMLFQRWRVECPSPSSFPLESGPMFYFPAGAKVREQLLIDHGNRSCYIIDLPAGEQIVPHHRDCTAVIIGCGTTDGVLDSTGEHLNIKG